MKLIVSVSGELWKDTHYGNRKMVVACGWFACLLSTSRFNLFYYDVFCTDFSLNNAGDMLILVEGKKITYHTASTFKLLN